MRVSCILLINTRHSINQSIDFFNVAKIAIGLAITIPFIPFIQFNDLIAG